MKNIQLKSLALSLVALGTLASCADEPININFEKAKNEFHVNWIKTFGPIDPAQTWNMASTVEARVDKTVFGDSPTVIIYDDDPDYGGRIIGISHSGESVKLDRESDAYDVYAIVYNPGGDMSKGYYTIKNGSVDINIKYVEGGEEMGARSRSAHTPSKFDWMLAFEDLGSTGDYDFNDVVIGVNYVAGSGQLKLTPMAAGGTLETYVLFKGSRVTPEVHSWLSGKEGAPIKSMLNTNVYNIMQTQPTIIDVDENWNIAENLGDISLEVNGFNQTVVITKPQAGTAPQMLCLAGDWYWPKEKLDIKDVFPSFKTWSGNADATGWMDDYDDAANVVPWEYRTRSYIYGITANNDNFETKYNGTITDSGFSGGISKYNQSGVQEELPCDIFNLCFEAGKLKSIDFSKFDSSTLTSMKRMFYSSYNLEEITFGNFYTSNVTDMNSLFYGCVNLKALDLSSFDTSKVTDMGYMFIACQELTSLDVSNFDTSRVKYMNDMFHNCTKITTLDLSNFDTSNVTDMSSMFCVSQALTSLDISNFDTSNVTNMSQMFYVCQNLPTLDLSSFDTSNVTDMSSMFYVCQALTSLDISNFDTSNVTNMSEMFASCYGLSSLDLSNFDITNVTNMYRMFETCTSLTFLDLSSFDTSNVKNMSEMFRFCRKLTSLDLSNFDASNVTKMDDMFSDCRSDLTIKTNRAFRDWCIYNASIIKLPFELCDRNSDQWILVD